MKERTIAARQALLQAKSKPLSDLQKLLLRDITQRLNISVDMAKLEESGTAVEAEALLLRAQAEFAVRRVAKRLW